MAAGVTPFRPRPSPAAALPAAAGPSAPSRAGAWPAWVTFGLLALASSAQAQTAVSPVEVTPRPPVIGGRPIPDPCAVASKTEEAACAARKLQDAARAAQATAGAGAPPSAPDARSPDTAVGLGDVGAASQRLGGDLRGATTLPKREVLPAPTNPYARGR